MFFGGVLLTTLPVALGVDVMTFLDPRGSYYGYVGGGNNTVGQPQLCFSINGSGSSSFPITCILQNIATNVVPVAIETTFILCYVIALVVALNIIVGLARSRRSYNSEPPKHWHIKLFIAGLLANIPVFMGDVATSFGYNSIVDENGYQGMSGSSPSSLLAYNPPGGTSALTQYASTIQWGMVILSMFGVFYFIYGVLVGRISPVRFEIQNIENLSDDENGIVMATYVPIGDLPQFRIDAVKAFCRYISSFSDEKITEMIIQISSDTELDPKIVDEFVHIQDMLTQSFRSWSRMPGSYISEFEDIPCEDDINSEMSL